jgi:pilus assembly protein CpaB
MLFPISPNSSHKETIMPKRSGIVLISIGLALAILSAVVVIGIARQATAASQAQVRQVSVVTAKRDILDQTQITADALEIKAFPADFAPPGVYSTTDDLVGRYAQGFLPRGQVIVAGQAKLAPQTPNISDRIPAGYVVMWLPQPDTMSGTNILKPGDHVDLLLTAPVSAGDKNGLSTQTTLQNIEIYRIGEDELGVPPATTGDSKGALAPSSSSQSRSTSRSSSIGLLVDHQNAVVMKFIKDSGGTLDLVTRSANDEQLVRTDGVTLDTLTEQFRFRIPQSKVIGA